MVGRKEDEWVDNLDFSRADLKADELVVWLVD